MTCWRRLRDRQQDGIGGLIHFALLDWLFRGGRIDWSRAVVDSCSARAVFWGLLTAPNPTDRRCRPESLLGDRAYDAEYIRYALRDRQILPRMAMRNTQHSSGLERWR